MASLVAKNANMGPEEEVKQKHEKRRNKGRKKRKGEKQRHVSFFRCLSTFPRLSTRLRRPVRRCLLDKGRQMMMHIEAVPPYSII